MHTGYHALIGAAAHIPVPASVPILSFSPIVLPAPLRPTPLEIRITVPAIGAALPLILLSHGQGRSNHLSSLEGYAPLAEFWAAHGFAVLQPTHLSSSFLALKAPHGQELFWQERAADMGRILDNLDAVEAAVPGLDGRLDRSRVAVVGHSAGSHTATILLGASNTDPRDGARWHKPDPRIKAGVVLAGIGNGGTDLSANAKMRIPFYGADFSSMTAPTLVVYGDQDVSPHLTVRGADWHADAYSMAPGPKDLLVLKGGGHVLGGISGWDAGETVDESPERVGLVQRMTWAYLRSALYEGDGAWGEACRAFERLGQGTVEGKR